MSAGRKKLKVEITTINVIITVHEITTVNVIITLPYYKFMFKDQNP